MVTHPPLHMGVYFQDLLLQRALLKSVRTKLKLHFLKWHSVSTGTAEEAPPAEETDAQPVKRAADEEEVGCH